MLYTARHRDLKYLAATIVYGPYWYYGIISAVSTQ